MKKYHKIQTVYLRNPEDKFKTLLEGQFAKPEFEYLKNNSWVWTEKIDGTNIRILWDGQILEFRGKSDRAQIPPFLIQQLEEMFTNETLVDVFGEELDIEVALYGEGYGARIEKSGKKYLPDSVSFILFDVNINGMWLEQENVRNIASQFGIDIVPVIGNGGLLYAIDMIRKGFYSTIALDNTFLAEGLVLRPEVELLDRRGERIITKIKFRDFKRD